MNKYLILSIILFSGNAFSIEKNKKTESFNDTELYNISNLDYAKEQNLNSKDGNIFSSKSILSKLYTEFSNDIKFTDNKLEKIETEGMDARLLSVFSSYVIDSYLPKSWEFTLDYDNKNKKEDYFYIGLKKSL